jgi:hypothetical protein
MDRHLLEEYLAVAEMDVTTAEVRLLVQRRLVSDLRRDGLDTTESEKFLARLEAMRAMHLEHRERLRLGLNNLKP